MVYMACCPGIGKRAAQLLALAALCVAAFWFGLRDPPTNTLILQLELSSAVSRRHPPQNMNLRPMCHARARSEFSWFNGFNVGVLEAVRCQGWMWAQVKDNTFLDWFSRRESRHPVFGKVSGRWFQHVLVSSIHLFVKLSWGVQAGWIILE